MNKTFPTIYNTYQCYLTDTPSRVALHLQRARQGGYVIICNWFLLFRNSTKVSWLTPRRYIWAAKIVRGAYMVQERKRAKDLGYKVKGKAVVQRKIVTL